MKINYQKFTIFFSLILFLGFGLVQEGKASSSADQIIVSVTEARIRTTPSLKGEILGGTQIGTVYDVKDKRGDWYQIAYENGKRGWISGTIVKNFYHANRGVIYQQLADKYLAREKLDFDNASEVFNFLSNARHDVENRNVQAALKLRRFRMLNRTLEAIPFDKARPWEEKEVSKYKDFVTTNESEVVYSEPAGQWFVNSESIWNLQDEYKDLPIADDIAWQATENPIPGECEGFITCYVPLMNMTYGEYLKRYPAGKYGKKVLGVITENLKLMVENNHYEPPVKDELPEFRATINELKTTVAKTSYPETHNTLNFLDRLSKKYK